MAVQSFYPSTAFSVGKSFLGEYLTGFLAQRKEDHNLMIKRKLAALDPTNLIKLEQGHIKNIGQLQEQIARIQREGLQTKGRMDVARIKAWGAIRVQEVAKSSRHFQHKANLIKGLYETAMDGQAGYTAAHQPSRQAVQGVLAQVPKSAGAAGSPQHYIPAINGFISREPDDTIKQEWLAAQVMQVAINKGHTAAVDAMRKQFGGWMPSLYADNPLQAFYQSKPQLNAMTWAEEAVNRASAQLGVPGSPASNEALQILSDQFKADKRAPAGLTAGEAPIGYLQEMLQSEKGQLREVRAERKQMQREYRETAIGSYMKSWIAPSYTREPGWQRDWEILGEVGQIRPTVFQNYMESVQDYWGEHGEVDVEAIGDIRRLEEIDIEGGAVPAGAALGADFPLPGNPSSVRMLGQAVDKFREYSRGYGRASEQAIDELFGIYTMIKQAPDRYGQTGAAIMRAIEKAYASQDPMAFGNLHDQVITLAQRGVGSLTEELEPEDMPGTPGFSGKKFKARVEKYPETRDPDWWPADRWPLTETTQAHIDALKGANPGELAAWAKQQLDRREKHLEKGGEAYRAVVGRMDALLGYVYGTGRGEDAPSLLLLKERKSALGERESALEEFKGEVLSDESDTLDPKLVKTQALQNEVDRLRMIVEETERSLTTPAVAPAQAAVQAAYSAGEFGKEQRSPRSSFANLFLSEKGGYLTKDQAAKLNVLAKQRDRLAEIITAKKEAKERWAAAQKALLRDIATSSPGYYVPQGGESLTESPPDDTGEIAQLKEVNKRIRQIENIASRPEGSPWPTSDRPIDTP